MKMVHDATFQSLEQWSWGNGQTFKELLLRKAVDATVMYATDILYTLKKLPELMESCNEFALFVSFSECHIEHFLDVDGLHRRDSLIRDAKVVWAIVWDENPEYPESKYHRLRIFDVTEEALPQIRDGKFPMISFPWKEDRL